MEKKVIVIGNTSSIDEIKKITKERDDVLIITDDSFGVVEEMEQMQNLIIKAEALSLPTKHEKKQYKQEQLNMRRRR